MREPTSDIVLVYYNMTKDKTIIYSCYTYYNNYYIDILKFKIYSKSVRESYCGN